MWPTVRTNATHLLSAFRSEPAWLFGDIDALMPEDLTAEEQIDYVKSALQKTTTLRPVDLCCTHFAQQYIGSHIIENASDTILA